MDDSDSKENKQDEQENREPQPAPIIGPLPPPGIVGLLRDILRAPPIVPYDIDTEEDEDADIDSSDDDQDDSVGMIFGNIYPYRRALPVPEETKSIRSEPILAECNVCRENMIDTITFPCHHAAMCVSCARDYGRVQQTCPVCRTTLQAIERLYLSFTRHTPIIRPRPPPMNPRPSKKPRTT
jgi:hypothetical protein